MINTSCLHSTVFAPPPQYTHAHCDTDTHAHSTHTHTHIHTHTHKQLKQTHTRARARTHMHVHRHTDTPTHALTHARAHESTETDRFLFVCLLLFFAAFCTMAEFGVWAGNFSAFSDYFGYSFALTVVAFLLSVVAAVLFSLARGRVAATGQPSP